MSSPLERPIHVSKSCKTAKPGKAVDRGQNITETRPGLPGPGSGLISGSLEIRQPWDQAGSYLPLAASHLSLVMAEKPCPLQAFRPLQEWLPPLQALWPLQALAPTHLPSPAA